MNDIAPGIGHNLPPLAEQLSDEARPFRERADALIGNLNASRIDSPETAAAVTTLGNMLRDLKDKAEAARKERAKPFDEGKAAVQAAFKRDIIDPIDAAMATARRMVDAWRRKLDEQAAAERRQREAEAAEAQRLADEAEAKKAAAEQSGDIGAAVKAEMEALQAAERAAALQGDDGTIRPDAIIRVQSGNAGTSVQVTGKIEDIGKCLAWMIRNDNRWLSETIQPRVNQLLRSKLDVDGVLRVETSSTRFFR